MGGPKLFTSHYIFFYCQTHLKRLFLWKTKAFLSGKEISINNSYNFQKVFSYLASPIPYILTDNGDKLCQLYGNLFDVHVSMSDVLVKGQQYQFHVSLYSRVFTAVGSIYSLIFLHRFVLIKFQIVGFSTFWAIHKQVLIL